eukprot:3042102-Prymnesium_polylepis.1
MASRAGSRSRLRTRRTALLWKAPRRCPAQGRRRMLDKPLARRRAQGRRRLTRRPTLPSALAQRPARCTRPARLCAVHVSSREGCCGVRRTRSSSRHRRSAWRPFARASVCLQVRRKHAGLQKASVVGNRHAFIHGKRFIIKGTEGKRVSGD